VRKEAEMAVKGDLKFLLLVQQLKSGGVADN
jgi:hypothetical protein